MRFIARRSWALASTVLGSGIACLHAEPIQLVHPEATYYTGSPADLASVVDGVKTGPRGWSTFPNVHERQALVVRCERPIEADELDITLFFLAGRPLNAIADFGLSFTTDAHPSLSGNWQPLEILSAEADVTKLRWVNSWRLISEIAPREMTGIIPDDVYRLHALLPGRVATGFRLETFPVKPYDSENPGLSWHAPHDFTLTEFRVADHARETTNVALQKPVRASHPLEVLMSPEALTDGLPATIAHPGRSDVGANFWFEIDLGRTVQFDHFGLRTRGDGWLERFTRMQVNCYLNPPASGAASVWTGMVRSDGSYPAPGEAEIMRAENGSGIFHGRYLRIQSDNPEPFSPQLAEVEVYESRRLELMRAHADGREIPFTTPLDLPPGTRLLSLQLRIPQAGMPPDVRFRWRMRGDLENWRASRVMRIEMPCPPPGDTVFEAQALHSDGVWDQTIFRLPVRARQHLWQTSLFRWLASGTALMSAVALSILITRRRNARKLAGVRAEAALANERSRIARDIHDDLGVSLTQIAMQCEIMEDDIHHPLRLRAHLAELSDSARSVTRAVDEIVWAVTPDNDNLNRFATFMSQFVQNSLRSTTLACRLHLPADLPDLTMEATVRHHLYLVVREGINNIIRHAKAKTVRFTLSLSEDVLTLALADDGVGFTLHSPHTMPDAERLSAGNGINNMRKRMDEIGGSLEITSSPTVGTTITLQQKLRPFAERNFPPTPTRGAEHKVR